MTAPACTGAPRWRKNAPFRLCIAGIGCDIAPGSTQAAQFCAPRARHADCLARGEPLAGPSSPGEDPRPQVGLPAGHETLPPPKHWISGCWVPRLRCRSACGWSPRAQQPAALHCSPLAGLNAALWHDSAFPWRTGSQAWCFAPRAARKGTHCCRCCWLSHHPRAQPQQSAGRSSFPVTVAPSVQRSACGDATWRTRCGPLCQWAQKCPRACGNRAGLP